MDQCTVMEDIRTFVYFDVEATGLKSSGRPRVCEISLLAVGTSDILDLHKSLLNCISDRTDEDTIIQVETCSPRIMNKLTLCVYPMATIVPLVSSMTGLDNYNLTGQSKFDKNIGNLLDIFLSRLPSPVCLVAHNGSQYDFPLLRAEMEKAGTNLGSQILCVDSYLGMKSIMMNRHQISSELKAVTELANAGEFDTDMMEGTCTTLKTGFLSETLKNWATVAKQKNESTPTRSISLLYEKQRKKKLQEINHAEKSMCRRKLDFSDFKMPTSFSLINLHKHFFGCPPKESHGA